MEKLLELLGDENSIKQSFAFINVEPVWKASNNATPQNMVR